MRTSIIITVALLSISNILYAQNMDSQDITKQEKGYFNITELGFFYGNSNIRYRNFGEGTAVNISSLRTINGLFLTPKISIGIGAGLDGVNVHRYKFFNTFNIFADARYYLNNKKHVFFFYGDLGSAVKIDDNLEKGLMFNFGVGRKITIVRGFVIVPSIGYNQQNFKDGGTSFRNETLALKMGVLF